MRLDGFTALIWNPDKEAKKKYQNKLRCLHFKHRNPDYEKKRWAKDKDKRKAQKKKRHEENPELRERENARSREYYRENREYLKAKHREYWKGYYEENREKVLEYQTRYREENREACRERCRPHYRHNSAKRKRHIKERTPPWADLEAIKFFYECCPAGCHVDHIIPLRGKKMSGLHIAENLQWLPEKENMSKSNTVDREIARRI